MQKTNLDLFQRILSPPIFADDHQTRVARSLHHVLIASASLSLLFSAAMFLLSASPPAGLLTLTLTIAAAFLPMLLNHRGKTNLACTLYITFFWLLISLFLLISGGVSTVAPVLYIPLITIALILLGWRGALFTFGAVLIYALLIAAANPLSLPNNFPITSLGSWGIIIIALVMILVPVYQIYQEWVTIRNQLLEHQNAEKVLRLSEERFRLIASVTSDYTFSSRFDGHGGLEQYSFVGAFEALSGYTPEEFIKLGGWLAILHPDDRAQDARDFATLKENKPVATEVRIIRKDGQIRWVRIYGYPLWDNAHQNLVGIYGAVQDINERKLAEQALQESEERFRLISSVSSDYTFSTRFDGPDGFEHTVYGDAFETITGYTPDEFVQLGGWLSIVHPDDKPQDDRDMATLRRNKTVVSELRIIRKDGQVCWVRTYGYPLWDAANQKLIGIYGAVQNINERKLAEQALQESEEGLRLISSITSDYTYASRLNADGKLELKALTGAFATITGYTPEEFVKLGGWQAILHPDDQAQNDLDSEKLRQNQSSVTEARIYKKDGTLRWVRMYGYPVWDTTNNRLIGINGAVQDITDRKLAEQALVESENRYRIVSESISDYAYAYDIHPDGSFTSFWVTDDSFMRLTGYNWLEVGGTFSLYHPDDVPLVKDHVQQTISGNATSGEYRIITKNGETRWISIKRQVEWDEDAKRFVRFYGAAQDITERKQAERAIAQERMLLRTVIDQQPDNIFVKDRNSKFLLNSAESMRILGVSRQEDLLGKDDFDFLPPEIAQKWYETQQQIMESGEPVINRVIYQPWHKDKRRWVLFSSIPLRDDQGVVTGLLGIDRDISDQKRSEEAIREKEAFLRILLDATSDVVFLMDLQGHFLTVNKPMAESMRTSVENLIGHNGFDLLPPELRDQRLSHFKVCIATKQPVQWEDHTANGWWDNTIYPVLSPSGDVESFAIYSKEITEQKRIAAELQRYATQLEQMVEERTAELRRAKDQIEIILNNTRDAIALAQANGDIETRNPAFMSMFGDQVSNWLERLLGMVATEEQSMSVGKALLNTIQSQEGQRVELQLLGENGRSTDIDLAFIPVRMTDKEQQSGILVSAHDITHIKQIERFKTKFIDDAVHDLATPIAGLTTRLYLLKRSPEKLDDHLRKLENQVGHLRNLLDDLRSLSQLDRGQLDLSLEWIDANQIVARVFDTYEPVAISKGQTLNLITDFQLPQVQVDTRQMERVFVNLVANAINYSPNDKPIIVRTAREGDNVVFSVTDQGIGIGPRDLPHIFERFYRSDDARTTQSSGTGLGLAIVKEIVEQHGGNVSATSILGEGSTFTVRLPAKQSA
ncbi:MAG: PAS domain S-box protein [Anaerolineaceae bacterium]|nr:PAS domain S-box protein [Anaerolineaceae bacterium]